MAGVPPSSAKRKESLVVVDMMYIINTSVFLKVHKLFKDHVFITVWASGLHHSAKTLYTGAMKVRFHRFLTLALTR
jgi:hypothetical protein